MGGRGAYSATNSGGQKSIAMGTRDIRAASAGASYRKLPANLQKSINENLKMGNAMQKAIASGNKNNMTEEWVTGFGKNKIKIVTAEKNGKLGYTVKKGNKTLQNHVTKERAANAVAAFYLGNMK